MVVVRSTLLLKSLKSSFLSMNSVQENSRHTSMFVFRSSWGASMFQIASVTVQGMHAEPAHLIHCCHQTQDSSQAHEVHCLFQDACSVPHACCANHPHQRPSRSKFHELAKSHLIMSRMVMALRMRVIATPSYKSHKHRVMRRRLCPCAEKQINS